MENDGKNIKNHKENMGWGPEWETIEPHTSHPVGTH